MKRLTLVIIILFLTSCNYRPVRYDDTTEACNLMYSTMSLVAHAKKEISLVDDTIEECIKSINQKKAECLRLIYGTNLIEKGNFKKYNQYRQCIKDQPIIDSSLK